MVANPKTDANAHTTKGSIVSGGLEGMAVLVTAAAAAESALPARRDLPPMVRPVTICGRTESKLEAVAENIAPNCAHGGRIQTVVADVTLEDDVERAVDKAAGTHTGGLDGCIANAGARRRDEPLSPPEHRGISSGTPPERAEHHALREVHNHRSWSKPVAAPLSACRPSLGISPIPISAPTVSAKRESKR